MSRALLTLIVVTLMLAVNACTAAPKEPPLPNYTVRQAGNPPQKAGLEENQCLSYGDPNFPDYPNAKIVAPGTKFLKTWRIDNLCSVSTKGWKAVKIAGEVEGPATIELPDIPSHGKGEVSVELIAATGKPPGGLQCPLPRPY